MRHFTIAVATVAIAALAAAAPASAQQHSHGGPMKAGNQCWKHHGAGSDHAFGHFQACPQPAGNLGHRAARHRS
jgi:hypothetical protein